MPTIIQSTFLMPALALSLIISYRQSQDQGRYQKWLNEDVAYLITPYEKQAFLELKTDA